MGLSQLENYFPLLSSSSSESVYNGQSCGIYFKTTEQTRKWKPHAQESKLRKRKPEILTVSWSYHANPELPLVDFF